MRSAMIAILCVSLALVFESASSAQRFEVLRGMVKIAGGPVPVRLRLEKWGAAVTEAVLREGWFEFSNVAEGRYTLVAEAPGYETVRQEVIVPGEFPVLQLRPVRGYTGGSEVVPAWNLKIPQAARREFDAGKSKLRRNNCVEALNHWRKAIQSYAAYGDAHRAMGECYLAMEQLEDAEREFKTALEQPHTPDLHLLLGKVYARQANDALMTRQIELFAAEEKPGPLRDRALDALFKSRTIIPWKTFAEKESAAAPDAEALDVD
jgi:tetratricopeptide (TPR) repeat protein